MSVGTDRVSLGGRVSEGEQHTLHRVRDISETVAVELEAKFRTVRRMAEAESGARASASGNRLLALFETASSEFEEGGISALTQKITRLELGAFARFASEHIELLASSDVEATSDSTVTERLRKRLENLVVLISAINEAVATKGRIIDLHEGAMRIYPIGNSPPISSSTLSPASSPSLRPTA